MSGSTGTRWLPTSEQIDLADAVVADARQGFRDTLVIDYVTRDYHAARPKSYMGGWGRQSLNVTPSGRVLPCHAVETLTHLTFPSVRDASLGVIWQADPAFACDRSTDWMAEPCRSCERREIYWGGCRCQAFALTGNAAATDPARALSPDHTIIAAAMAAPRPATLSIAGSKEPSQAFSSATPP